MEVLEPYRLKIDMIDDQIIDLLTQRMEIINEVAKIKSDRDIPAIIEERVDEVINRCADRAADKGLDPELVRRLYAVLVAWCCMVEDEYIKSHEPAL